LGGAVGGAEEVARAFVIRAAGGLALASVAAFSTVAGSQAPAPPDFEALPFAPRHAICYRAGTPMVVDGALDEPAWQAPSWSDPFVDIQGERRPAPRYRTRVKMLWDTENFYVAAEMEEPNLWGTLTDRDSVIFHDNDFELFIDPDGDTHNYYELEVNALGTAWDLLLPKPYRDGGPPIDAWDISGLRVGVKARGTLNHPGDRDDGWTVEIAMPWRALREAAPERRLPHAGEQWRINFSRVEWQLDVIDGRYVARRDPRTSKVLPEDNWVWSPQGAINMHMPERWGIVQFSDVKAGEGTDRFVDDPNDRVKWALRCLYYRERAYREAHGRYTADLAALGADDLRVEGLAFQPSVEATANLYEFTAAGADGSVVHLQQDGRVWVTRTPRYSALRAGHPATPRQAVHFLQADERPVLDAETQSDRGAGAPRHFRPHHSA
jgi:hypothetical protein